MVIKVYVTNISSNMKIKKEMLHVTDTLSSMGIDIEQIDIADPCMEKEKNFMRENAQPKEGQKVPMPPQIFNDDIFCGNYDHFYQAVEMNGIYEFLKMADKIETSTAQIENIAQQEVEQTCQD